MVRTVYQKIPTAHLWKGGNTHTHTLVSFTQLGFQTLASCPFTYQLQGKWPVTLSCISPFLLRRGKDVRWAQILSSARSHGTKKTKKKEQMWPVQKWAMKSTEKTCGSWVATLLVLHATPHTRSKPYITGTALLSDALSNCSLLALVCHIPCQALGEVLPTSCRSHHMLSSLFMSLWQMDKGGGGRQANLLTTTSLSETDTGKVRQAGRIFPEHLKQSFLDPEHSFVAVWWITWTSFTKQKFAQLRTNYVRQRPRTRLTKQMFAQLRTGFTYTRFSSPK